MAKEHSSSIGGLLITMGMCVLGGYTLGNIVGIQHAAKEVNEGVYLRNVMEKHGAKSALLVVYDTKAGEPWKEWSVGEVHPDRLTCDGEAVYKE